MNVEELAKQAGMHIEENWVLQDGVFVTNVTFIERFAELVAAAEREACAKLCDEKALYFQYDFIPPYDVADSCAEEIRARSKHD